MQITLNIWVLRNCTIIVFLNIYFKWRKMHCDDLIGYSKSQRDWNLCRQKTGMKRYEIEVECKSIQVISRSCSCEKFAVESQSRRFEILQRGTKNPKASLMKRIMVIYNQNDLLKLFHIQWMLFIYLCIRMNIWWNWMFF